MNVNNYFKVVSVQSNGMQEIKTHGIKFYCCLSHWKIYSVYDCKNDTMYTDKEFYSTTTSKYRNLFNDEFQPLSIIKVDNEELHRIIGRG